MPEYSGINQYVQNRSSQYHSMQLSLNRRYANGFTVRANYTLADLQGTIGGPELVPYFHPQSTRSSTSCGTGGSATCGGIVSSPPGSTTSLGPQEGVVGTVVGGWQVTGIYQWQSGQPFTVESGRDNAGWGLGSNRAIYTGAPFDPPRGI